LANEIPIIEILLILTAIFLLVFGYYFLKSFRAGGGKSCSRRLRIT